MDVLTAFEVVLDLTGIVHTDGMVKYKKHNTHLNYKVGNGVPIAVSLVSEE